MVTYKKLVRNEVEFTAYCGLEIFEFDQLKEALDVEIRRGRLDRAIIIRSV